MIFAVVAGELAVAEPQADKFWRIFAAIWLCVGLPFLAIGLWSGWDELPWARLPVEGVLTRGEVLAKDRGADGQFVVRYRFVATAETLLPGMSFVDEETWKRLAMNGPIRIMFLAESPHVHLVEGHLREGRMVFAAIFTGLGGLLTTLGTIILVRWFALQREARAAPSPRTVAATAPEKPRKMPGKAPRSKAEKRARREQRSVPAEPPEPGWKGALKMFINVILVLVAIFAAAVVVEIFPLLRGIESWMERHEFALLAATGGACLLGIGLLLGSMLLRLMESSASHRRGVQRPLEFSLRALKHSAQERKDFPWVAAVGAVFIAFGAFGVTIALAPMALKLVFAAVLGYAVLRTCWAIAKA